MLADITPVHTERVGICWLSRDCFYSVVSPKNCTSSSENYPVFCIPILNGAHLCIQFSSGNGFSVCLKSGIHLLLLIKSRAESGNDRRYPACRRFRREEEHKDGGTRSCGFAWTSIVTPSSVAHTLSLRRGTLCPMSATVPLHGSLKSTMTNKIFFHSLFQGTKGNWTTNTGMVLIAPLGPILGKLGIPGKTSVPLAFCFCISRPPFPQCSLVVGHCGGWNGGGDEMTIMASQDIQAG